MDQDRTAEELKRNNEQANKSGDQNDEEFPGYPHYPAKEDIMNAGKDGRVDLDVEGLPKRGSNVSVDLKDGMPAKSGTSKNEGAVGDMDDDDLQIVPGTEADVNEDDLHALRTDTSDIEPMNRVKLDPVDEEEEGAETDLDVPGSEFDDANESIGEEDEENNYYSLGGDAHENLEEDRSTIPNPEE